MIPLRDNIPSRSRPIVTYLLIALNVLVYWFEVQLGPRLDEFIQAFGLVPARFHHARDPIVRVLPVFTSMFLHGSFMHLAGNMLYLHIFGDNVEDRLGHLRFLAFYLICGAAAALAQVTMLGDSRLPMVGASGAIAGVTGAYFVFFRHARVLTLVPIFFYVQLVQIPAVVFLLLWFVMQLALGAASLGSHGADVGGVAWWAHIGGFVSGAVGGFLLAPRRPASRLSYGEG
jgi:membrane associated rhomboid family serine protease